MEEFDKYDYQTPELEGFGLIIKYLEFVLDLSMTELADLLETSVSSISRWANSRNAPRQSIEKIELALGCKIELINGIKYNSYRCHFNKDSYFYKRQDELGFSNRTKAEQSKMRYAKAYKKPPTPSEQVNEPAVDFNNKDLHKIMLEVMEEATAEDKAVLGKYFIKVLSRYKGE